MSNDHCFPSDNLISLRYSNDMIYRGSLKGGFKLREMISSSKMACRLQIKCYVATFVVRSQEKAIKVGARNNSAVVKAKLSA